MSTTTTQHTTHNYNTTQHTTYLQSSAIWYKRDTLSRWNTSRKHLVIIECNISIKIYLCKTRRQKGETSALLLSVMYLLSSSTHNNKAIERVASIRWYSSFSFKWVHLQLSIFTTIKERVTEPNKILQVGYEFQIVHLQLSIYTKSEVASHRSK